MSEFGSKFPVHRDQLAVHGGKKLNDFSVKSCGETQRYDHQIPQKLSTCRQTDRFLAGFYNSSLVRNFERPLEDHCGIGCSTSAHPTPGIWLFVQYLVSKSTPQTGILTPLSILDRFWCGYVRCNCKAKCVSLKQKRASTAVFLSVSESNIERMG